MMLGIVGSEAKKFTKETEDTARRSIAALCTVSGATGIVSGGCHLGGIDAWAAEHAHANNLLLIEHLPANLSWAAGYKPRNLLIARDCDACFCITVRELPAGYTGMRFKLCYHCGVDTHVKSGGCWTVKEAKKLGKPGEILVIG